MTALADVTAESPYVGLSYFTEAESDFFVGRDSERQIIVANLRSSRLTLLYAGSGVGKSSLIRAGVAARLSEFEKRSLEERGSAGYIPVVFSSWRDDPVEDLIGEIEAALGAYAVNGAGAIGLPRGSLAEAMEAATAAVDATLLIILDQFEEYFLYRLREAHGGAFADELARCISRRDLRANFLIAVREDAYAGVGQLFKGRVENVYGNFLHLDYLNRASAREAIEEPITRFNDKHPDLDRASIEPALVETVLDEVRAGHVHLEHTGRGAVVPSNGQATAAEKIETPYLQLVMTTLWERERSAGSHTLRLSTLKDLGGAQEIVRNHLNAALAGLSPEERDTAVDVFHQLVTPSGTKIVHTISDLAAYTNRPPEVVGRLVEKLSGSQERILRPVPAGEDGKPRVEIYHDVLAPAILAWRTEQAAERLRSEKRQAERRARTLFVIAASAVTLLVVALVAVVFAEVQRSRAHRAQNVAESGQLAAQALVDDQAGPLSRGLLLAAEAFKTAPTAQAREALIGGLVETQSMAADLEGGTGAVNSVAFDPRGGLIASGTTDEAVVLWNLSNGRRRTLYGRHGAVESVAFSPTGATLASSSGDGAIVLWNVDAGHPVRTLRSSDGAVYDVAYSRQGSTLASASADGVVTLWDTTTGQRLKTFRGPAVPANAVAFSPDGRTLASAAADGSVVLWDVASGARLHVLRGHAGEVNALDFSPDGGTIVTGNGNGWLALWDAGNGAYLGAVHPAAGSSPAVTSVAFSSDGTAVASGSKDGSVRVWNASGQLLRVLHASSQGVQSVAFAPGSHVIASGSNDGSLIVWNAQPDAGAQTLHSKHGTISSLAYNRDGEFLASANKDGTVGLFNPTTGHQSILNGHSGVAESVAFSPDGSALASAGADGSVILWNVATGKRQLTVSAGLDNVLYGVQFSPSGRTLAAGSASGDVYIWDATTGALVHNLQGHFAPIYAVAFSPDGRMLAGTSGDGSVLIWDPRDGRLLRTLVGHAAQVTSVAFSPDGSTLASASADDTVVLWNARTGKQLGDPLRHQGPVNDVVFSPRARTLASASSDQTAVIWDLRTRLGQPVTGHDNAVTSVAYSPDGRTLASADSSGMILLSPAVPAVSNPETIYARLCSVARRNLTRAEWREYLPGQSYRKVCPNYP
ncbi:MAG TPA: WD40 repeat domain-containing protein [Solirubrobacteraceae bacterium]